MENLDKDSTIVNSEKNVNAIIGMVQALNQLVDCM